MNTFDEWYTNKKQEVGALTTPSIAAKRLGISKQHLNRIIELGRIQRHKYENKTFISENEINAEAERREINKSSLGKEAEEYFEILKETKIPKKKLLEIIINSVYEPIKQMFKGDKEIKKRYNEIIKRQYEENGKVNLIEAYKTIMDEMKIEADEDFNEGIKKNSNKAYNENIKNKNKTSKQKTETIEADEKVRI